MIASAAEQFASSISLARGEVIDPIRFINACWPEIQLYDKQKDILYSLMDNDETVVPAGNKLGKDFVTGLAVLWFFVSRHPCRIVTTSVDDTQLNAVLWGEIRRFLQTSVVGLSTDRGGSLLVNDQKIRKIVKGGICGLSYILGRVATDDGSGFLGHHIADTGDNIKRTLFVVDEASAVPDMYYDKATTWAQKVLIIGNPFPCSNFFRRGVKGGDTYSKDGKRCYRKVIKIRATDSPNVRFGLAQLAKGIEPTNEIVIHGVKPYDEYVKHMDTWDAISICIKLNADFYEGAEVFMYPMLWLHRAQAIARQLRASGKERIVEAIGCDPAEGGDDTAWTGVDRYGIVFQMAMKTPDTNDIPNFTIGLIRQYGVEPSQVIFDSGGGGKQHADNLRAKGFNVRTVAFGEAATDAETVFNPARGFRPVITKVDEKETKYIYKNRRAEMYHMLRLLLEVGWGIPAEYEEVLRQMEPIPLKYDGEGRIWLYPKNKKNPTSKEPTLVELIGNSPDELDSTVLAVYGMNCPKKIFTAKAL